MMKNKFYIIYIFPFIFIMKCALSQVALNNTQIKRFKGNNISISEGSIAEMISKIKNNDNELRISIFEIIPFVIINRNESGHLVVSGFGVDIFETIADLIGFRYKYVIQELLLYGTHTKTGWTGVIGLLVNKQTDICIVGTALTAERKEYIDFSPFVAFAYSVFVIKNPYGNDKDRLNYYAFLRPFPNSVWICSVIVTFLLRLSVIISQSVNRFIIYSEFFPKKFKSPSENAFAIFIRIFKQILCFDDFPSDMNLSTKILMFSWNIFRYLMISIYTGILISVLAVQTDESRFKTIEDVLETGKYKVGTVKNHWTATVLEESVSGVNKLIWQAMDEDPNNFVSTFDEGLVKSCQENYAFLLGFYTLKTLESKMNCSFYSIPQPYFQTSLHFTFQKDSPYTGIFAELLKRVQSTGIIKKLNKRYEETQWKDDSMVPTSTKLSDTIGSFLALCLSLPLIFFVLMSEICVRFTKKQEEKNKVKENKKKMVNLIFCRMRTKC